MARIPLVFTTAHTVKFSELDPYNHLRTAAYAAYFVDHRMTGLREFIGWDLQTLETLPFMAWVRRLEIDFLRPAAGDQAITITSFVREFRGPDADIECTMADAAERELARCRMVVACVSKATRRPMDWPADATALFYQGDAS